MFCCCRASFTLVPEVFFCHKETRDKIEKEAARENLCKSHYHATSVNNIMISIKGILQSQARIQTGLHWFTETGQNFGI